MKLNELIANHVGATSLNPQAVRAFLQTPPAYRQWGVRHQLAPMLLDQLTATDLFDFYLRWYLSGRHKTPKAVLREAKRFMDHDPGEAVYLIGHSLAVTRRQLLALEWYELMPRLDLVQQSLVRLRSQSDRPLSDGMIYLLSEID